MALETSTYIDGLVATNPVATDGLAQADDHMRLIKATIKATFPNITGAVTVTHTDLNTVTTPAFPSGTRMLFQQTAAPTGWTKDTANDDKALRVVSGTVGSGGTNALSSLDATAVGTVSSSISGATSLHYLSLAQIPSHTHTGSVNLRTNWEAGYSGLSPIGTGAARADGTGSSPAFTTAAAGGGGGHNHGVGSLAVSSAFTGTPNQLDIAYVDVIVAQKD